MTLRHTADLVVRAVISPDQVKAWDSGHVASTPRTCHQDI